MPSVISRSFLILLLSLSLFSCVSTPKTQVQVINEQRLSFSGKGAGAGLMLSGSMGPVGIALGVAIDVGIAKEIATTAERATDIDTLITRAFYNTQLPANFSQSTITLERFGFISWPGEGDRAAPQLHLSIQGVNGSLVKLHFPEDWQQADNAPMIASAPLEEIKRDPKVIEQLFSQAVRQIVAKLQAQK